MDKVSVKHLQIDKDQSSILAVIAAATVIVVFSLFATKAMVTKGLYQRRALNARHQVISQLKANYSAAKTLVGQYSVFANQDPNVLGGTAAGTSDIDGDNAKIVLDALPSSYDAPALASSIEKILLSQAVTINSLTITDDPIGNSDLPQANPTAKPETFSYEGTTNFATGQKLLQDFERSIRPFDLNTLEIGGKDDQLKLTAKMTTYFQPAKNLNLTPTKEVK